MPLNDHQEIPFRRYLFLVGEVSVLFYSRIDEYVV